MGNIFGEKPYTKCVKETISRALSKKMKLEHISGSVVTTKCDFIVLSQVNEISLTVNQFH